MIWVLVALFWLPAGYLGARLWCVIDGDNWPGFNWEKQRPDPWEFGIGILFGAITLGLAIPYVSITLCAFVAIWFINTLADFLGSFAPK